MGEAPSGPTVENRTAAPDPIEITALMSVVNAALVVIDGVAYVLVTIPLSVRPVPSVPLV